MLRAERLRASSSEAGRGVGGMTVFLASPAVPLPYRRSPQAVRNTKPTASTYAGEGLYRIITGELLLLSLPSLLFCLGEGELRICAETGEQSLKQLQHRAQQPTSFNTGTQRSVAPLNECLHV